MSPSNRSKKESQTYQTMLTELDDIVRSVGQGQLDLDEVVTKVEHGYKLIATMRERLDQTKAKVEKLRVDFEKSSSSSQSSDASTSEDRSEESDDDDDAPF